MSLFIAPQDPLPYLQKEHAQIVAVAGELHHNIDKLISQLQSLRAMKDAVANEIKRLGGETNDDQLEFKFEEGEEDPATA